jgi:hypothetical protein
MSVKYKVRDGILDRRIGDELLVHCFDSDEVFVLNSDAKRIFESLKDSRSVDEVLDLVTSQVFGDALELRRAVEQAVRELSEGGLIRSEE